MEYERKRITGEFGQERLGGELRRRDRICGRLQVDGALFSEPSVARTHTYPPNRTSETNGNGEQRDGLVRSNFLSYVAKFVDARKQGT